MYYVKRFQYQTQNIHIANYFASEPKSVLIYIYMYEAPIGIANFKIPLWWELVGDVAVPLQLTLDSTPDWF